MSHGEAIYRKLVWVYESVRTVGYLPGLYPGGRITGTVLLADDGYRFVADKGLFLLAALAALGYPQASATLSPETEGLIEREKIRDLPFVKPTPPSSSSTMRSRRSNTKSARDLGTPETSGNAGNANFQVGMSYGLWEGIAA